jgi:hypothetical protein
VNEAESEIIAICGGITVVVDRLTQRLHHCIEVLDVPDGDQPADPPASVCTCEGFANDPYMDSFRIM